MPNLRALHAAARNIAMFRRDNDYRRDWLMSQFDVSSFTKLEPREAHLCLDLLNAMGRGDSVQRNWTNARSALTQAQIDLALGLAIQCFAPNTMPRLSGLIRKLTVRQWELARMRPGEYNRLLGALRGSLGIKTPPRGAWRDRGTTPRHRRPDARTGRLATDRPGRRGRQSGRIIPICRPARS